MYTRTFFYTILMFFFQIYLFLLISKSKRQKHRRKSAEQKSGISYVVRLSSSLTMGWSCQFAHQTTSFGRLSPVSSSLGLISQSQPKTLQSLIYKRFITLSHEATICWHWSLNGNVLNVARQKTMLTSLINASKWLLHVKAL